MISFAPVVWNDGLREWLYADPDLANVALEVETRIKAERVAVMAARDGDGAVVGLLAASQADGYLLVEAVAGGPMVMRAAIQWSKEMARILGLKGSRAYTVKPGVVYHMARAGARLDGAILSWEA